jgi:hypothetical protein
VKAATAIAPQLEIDVADPDAAKKERERLSEYRQELLERFFRACRDVCRELTYDKVANELEADWGGIGRHVSSGVLKVCLAPGNERNYFRWEWCTYFADASEECADVMAEISGRKSKKDPKDELRDLQNIIRAEYPKQADKHIRKAATP